MLLRFWEFFVLLARNFEFTKTPRESFLAAYDCLLSGAPDALTHSIKSIPHFRWLYSIVVVGYEEQLAAVVRK